MRGVRFRMLPGGPLPWSDLAPMAARLADRGWHINLQLDGHTLQQHGMDVTACWSITRRRFTVFEQHVFSQPVAGLSLKKTTQQTART